LRIVIAIMARARAVKVDLLLLRCSVGQPNPACHGGAVAVTAMVAAIGVQQANPTDRLQHALTLHWLLETCGFTAADELTRRLIARRFSLTDRASIRPLGAIPVAVFAGWNGPRRLHGLPLAGKNRPRYRELRLSRRCECDGEEKDGVQSAPGIAGHYCSPSSMPIAAPL
jgi:hypothetical protein